MKPSDIVSMEGLLRLAVLLGTGFIGFQKIINKFESLFSTVSTVETTVKNLDGRVTSLQSSVDNQLREVHERILKIERKQKKNERDKAEQSGHYRATSSNSGPDGSDSQSYPRRRR